MDITGAWFLLFFTVVVQFRICAIMITRYTFGHACMCNGVCVSPCSCATLTAGEEVALGLPGRAYRPLGQVLCFLHSTRVPSYHTSLQPRRARIAFGRSEGMKTAGAHKIQPRGYASLMPLMTVRQYSVLSLCAHALRISLACTNRRVRPACSGGAAAAGGL